MKLSDYEFFKLASHQKLCLPALNSKQTSDYRILEFFLIIILEYLSIYLYNDGIHKEDCT